MYGIVPRASLTHIPTQPQPVVQVLCFVTYPVEWTEVELEVIPFLRAPAVHGVSSIIVEGHMINCVGKRSQLLREALCTLVGAKLNMFVRSSVRSSVRSENNHFLCLKNRGRDTVICLSVV